MILEEEHDRFRCRRAGCNESKGLRAGTYIEGRRIPYKTIVLFIYSWTQEYTVPIEKLL